MMGSEVNSNTNVARDTTYILLDAPVCDYLFKGCQLGCANICTYIPEFLKSRMHVWH